MAQPRWSDGRLVHAGERFANAAQDNRPTCMVSFVALDQWRDNDAVITCLWCILATLTR